MSRQTPEERFIRALEYARRPNGSKLDVNQGTLANALNILASEMNVKPTHYQLELIQNADDNKYPPEVEPTLTLAFRDDGYLWIGCNEIGFDEASVRALCDIGGSTKKATDGQKGYIGEKGIGFKSIFKVADKVWISSGNYHFSLSREGLGMISPVVEPFNFTDMLNERTMFCLRIPKKEDQIHVKGEMLGLRPELLLFLRKLRTINVVVDARKEKTTYKFSVHREDNAETVALGYTTTQLSRRDISPVPSTTSEHLVVVRHTTQSMPEEAKRPGIKQTEIVLAFPTIFDGASRMTFNFLPIRDYGFPFLLQADFITNVNREDINHHNKWNDALLVAAAGMFVQSVKTFNKAGTDQMLEFKYKWPQFLKSTHAASDTVMADFFPDLRKQLSKEPVLESQAGNLQTPASLSILSDRWTDRGNPPVPLFGEVHHLKLYVSKQYDQNDLAALSIKPQNAAYFAGLLKKLSAAELHQKPNEWHSKLAQAIMEAPPLPPKHLQNIKIIPLRDGTWVEPANIDNAIYFPDFYNRINAPDGLMLRIVDARAAEDTYRRLLFKKPLMVQDLNQQEVCELILKQHKCLDSDLPSLSSRTLIQQALYIFGFRQVLNPARLKVLRFAVLGTDCAELGHDIYMDSNVAHSFQMSTHFEPSQECKFIHPGYFDGIPEVIKTELHHWLQYTLGISTQPKLVDSQDGAYVLHPLFQRLVDLPDSTIWLTLLRDEWVYYKEFVKLLPTNCLQRALVTCKNNTRNPLNKVYWINPDVVKEHLAESSVDILEVNDRDKPWRDLDVLGLKRKVDLDFYMIILRKASRGEVPVSVKFSDVLRLMQGIHIHSTGRENSIRNAFDREKLIAVPTENDSLVWVTLKQCMWQAPPCFSNITALAGLYDTVENLFVKALELGDATGYDIAERLDLNADNLDKVENTKALLQALSKEIPGPGGDPLGSFDLEHLRRIAIFPVRQLNGSLALAAADDATWFVADEVKHQQLFQRKIALLDFTVQEIPHLMSLLRLLRIDNRTLSVSIQEEMFFQGTGKLLADWTAELQSKAKYIALLVPDQNKAVVESQLQAIEVYASKRMQMKRSVQIGGRKIYGNNESGKAVILERETPLQLHCRHRAINLKRAPWYFICETMAKVFRIPKTHHQTLTLILVTPPGPLIEDILSNQGLWDEVVSDIDDVDEEDEPEGPEDTPEERDAPVEGNNENENAASEDDDQSDDCLFVSSRQRSESEDSEAGMEDGARDEPEPTPTPTQTPSIQLPSARPSRAQPMINFSKIGPSPTEIRAAKKAQREKKAIAAVTNAAELYDLEAVEVYGPNNTTNQAEHLTGLAFERTKALHEYPDQNDGICYHGELFARTLFNYHFSSSDSSWTSPLRTRQKLKKPEIADLYNCSTFTVTDTRVAQLITEWLAECHYDPRGAQGDADQTEFVYHIYIKATEGDVDESFTVSNHEFELIKDWSSSETDIVLILRVYHLRDNPQFIALVDPINLMTDGVATVTAVDGFHMSVIAQD